MIGPGVVAVGSHAVLSGYVGWALARGAKTTARRYLAKGCFCFALFSLTNGFGYVTEGRTALVWFDVCNFFALATLLYFQRFALTLARPSGAPWSTWLSRALLAVGAALSAEASWRAASGGNDDAESVLVGIVNLVALSTILGTLGYAARRAGKEAPAARSFLLAFVWPVTPLLLHIAQNLAVSGAAAWYGIIRDISLLLFMYSLLIAYLDHGGEPMSIRDRFTAGTLTIVLGLVCAASELFVHDPAGVARMTAVMVAFAFVAIVVTPRFYRRNLVDPLDRLVGGMRSLQRGERAVVLPVAYDDELGYVTGAFNDLVGALDAAERELRTANDELRTQVAARSRELADALARVGAAGNRRLTEGDVIDGRYRIGRILGAGGMGTVYEAERIRDGRRLAVKIMQSTTGESASRFAREAQIAAPLDHENIVSIVDVGLWQGVAYVVMPLVEGGNLDGERARFGDAAWALPILAQIASALAALHERGIVHRDLKPANVLLSAVSGRLVVKITDFGIAFQEQHGLEGTFDAEAPTLTRLTATGAMMGTLPYMAPELANGGARMAGAPADVFAFGLIAHELLSATDAFDVPPILASRRGLPPPRALPSYVPHDLASAVTACLALEPAKRPAARDLAALLSGRRP